MGLTIFVRYRFGTTGAAGVDAEVDVVVAFDNDSTSLNVTKRPPRDSLWAISARRPTAKFCKESRQSLF